MARIQLRRGLKANLPTSNMLAGEPLFTTDKGNLYVAIDATTKVPVTPAIVDLVTISAVAIDDCLIIHDTSEGKEYKVSFSAFKAALNIPEASTDEKVAVVSGGTAGYIWGTDGTDGVIRMGSSMTWTKDASNGFVTLHVNVVDGGTF